MPKEVTFQTKPELAIAMLEHAWSNGVSMRWVLGDETYGDDTKVRITVESTGRFYLLAVSSNTRVWTEAPAVIDPFKLATGRPRTKVRLAPEAVPSTTVAAVAAQLPTQAWQRMSVANGAKGPITYDWAAVRVLESRDALPGPERWLLVRRSISDPTELAYFLSNAPEDTTLERLAQKASQRWTVEQCLEEGKGETGLDEYEVRSWDSWHRHITLSMMAHAWLASLRSRERFSPC